MYINMDDYFPVEKIRKLKGKRKVTDTYLTNQTNLDRKIIGCSGKESFQTPQMAHKVMQGRRNGKNTGNIYKCIFCGQFHIGALK